MRSFNSARFTGIFDRLIPATNLGLEKARWRVAGVDFHCERHSFWGSGYGFNVEVYTLKSSSREPWELLVIRETWWIGGRRALPKILRWAKLIAGKRGNVLAWFREREADLDSSSGPFA